MASRAGQEDMRFDGVHSLGDISDVLSVRETRDDMRVCDCLSHHRPGINPLPHWEQAVSVED